MALLDELEDTLTDGSDAVGGAKLTVVMNESLSYEVSRMLDSQSATTPRGEDSATRRGTN
jgi:hypothetical protein